MPHLDSTITASLWLCLIIVLFICICLKLKPARTRQFKMGKPDTKTFISEEDVIKELNNLQEQIKQSGKSGAKVFMNVRKIDKTISGDKETETQITSPEEEIRLLNEIEDKVKQGGNLRGHVKVILNTDVRKFLSTDSDKKQQK